MPELPEVETIKRALRKRIFHKTIVDVIINDPYSIKEPCSRSFKKMLKNAKVMQVLRKGKALLIILSNKKTLFIHLRMTGQIVYPGDGTQSRVSFVFSDGSRCDYNDRRRLGEMRLLDAWSEQPFFKALGPEPFDIGAARFAEVLSKRKTKIKSLLMDQRVIAGVGNLYAAEALFRAKIHPLRSAGGLSIQEKKRLLGALCFVLREAIYHKGSSLDQYVTVSGKRGGYVRFHKVYGRAGKKCAVCSAIIQRTVCGGRGTYFCERCQK